MKSDSTNMTATVGGIVTALVIFLLAHLVLGKNGDGNLVVFGVPAIVGGSAVFFIVRFTNRAPLRPKKK